MTQSHAALLEALRSAGAAVDRAGNMDLYGWRIGSWEIDVTGHLPDGTARHRPGEWHFAWVLEGRTIEDLWIAPRAGRVARATRPGTPTCRARRCATATPASRPDISSGQIP
jgi:hypothetical protein